MNKAVKENMNGNAGNTTGDGYLDALMATIEQLGGKPAMAMSNDD